MNQTYWKEKINAFLHDPPEKPLILFSETKHEDRAREIREALGVDDASITDKVKLADHIASGIDRPLFKKLEKIVKFIEKPEIINAISGLKVDERLFSSIKSEKEIIGYSKGIVDDALKELKSESGDDYRKMYVLLWRMFPQYLMNKEGSDRKIGFLWRYLPADTRLPYHSIWSHMTTTGAIYSSLPDPALFMFSIGPVQAFITTSKKTQDFWSSSLLLSYLSWRGMEYICQNYGPDHIVFPYLKGQPMADMWISKEFGVELFSLSESRRSLLSPSLPNRFLAIVPNDRVEEIGEGVRFAVEEAWYEISEKTFNEFQEKVLNKLNNFDNKSLDFLKAMWEEQVKDFLEMHYESVRWSPDEESLSNLDSPESVERFKEIYSGLLNLTDEEKAKEFKDLLEENNMGMMYGFLYGLVDRGMGMRKSLREFPQKSELGSKCTICGERSALIYGIKEELTKEFRNKSIPLRTHDYIEFWKAIASAAEQGIFDSEGKDRLCAIGVIKRYFGRNIYRKILGERYGISLTEAEGWRIFPSTAAISVSKYLFSLIEKTEEEGTPEYLFIENLRDFYKKEGRKVISEGSHPYKTYISLKEKELEKFEATMFYIHEVEKRIKEDKKNEAIYKTLISILNPGKSSKFGEETRRIVSGFPRYYALVKFDGDTMGMWLTGKVKDFPKIKDILHSTYEREIENDIKLLISTSLHAQISEALKDFSLNVVPRVTEEYNGVLVYSGGDDVFAMIPIENILDYVDAIRRFYSGETFDLEFPRREKLVSENGYIKLEKEGKTQDLYFTMGKATGSAGIVIAHYSTPLSFVIEKANEAEHRAKHEYHRNAFVFTIIRGSGQITNVGAKWWYKDGEKNESDGEIINRIVYIDFLVSLFSGEGSPDIQKNFFEEDWIRHLQSVSLSPSIITDLSDEIEIYPVRDDNQEIELLTRLKVLVSRHLEIKFSDETDKRERAEIRRNVIDSIIQAIHRLHVSLIEDLKKIRKDKSIEEIVNSARKDLINLLVLASFIARKGGE